MVESTAEVLVWHAADVLLSHALRELCLPPVRPYRATPVPASSVLMYGTYYLQEQGVLRPPPTEVGLAECPQQQMM